MLTSLRNKTIFQHLPTSSKHMPYLNMKLNVENLTIAKQIMIFVGSTMVVS